MSLRLAAVAAAALLVITALPAFAGAKDVASLRYFSDGSPAGGKSHLTRDGVAGTVASKINATH